MPYVKNSFYTALVLLLVLLPGYCNAQLLINPGFDSLKTEGIPIGWQLSSAAIAQKDIPFQYDARDKVDGAYSLRVRNDSSVAWLFQSLENRGLDATRITLSAWVKVTSGDTNAVKLFLKLTGIDSVTGYQETNAGRINGKNGWTRLWLTLPFDKERVRTIMVGAVLRGKITCHFDMFELLPDSVSAHKAKYMGDLAQRDTANRWSSGVSIPHLSPLMHERLYDVGMIWCYLKYYHPAFSTGEKNADVALCSLLKKASDSLAQKEWYGMLKSWVLDLGEVPATKRDPIAQGIGANDTKHAPHFGSVLQPGHLPDALYELLLAIRENKAPHFRGYYADVTDRIGNVSFSNERPYDYLSLPDDGLRLLALFRYWGMINYFYPYRESLDDWDKTLHELIPVFLQAKDTQAYVRSCLQLVSAIHDSHGFVTNNPTLEKIKGDNSVPFLASFIDRKLTITRPCPEYGLKPGDIILDINHIPVQKLVDSFRTLLSASNEAGYLRDLSSPFGYLFRSNDSLMQVTVKGRTGNRTLIIRKVDKYKLPVKEYNDFTVVAPPSAASKWLPDSIGYLYPGAFNEANFQGIMDSFRGAKGLVVDLRCYPSLFIPYRLTDLLKGKSTEFCYTTVPDINEPGRIYVKKPLSCGTNDSREPFRYPVVLLVNEWTQSQSEFTAMALATIPGAIVLGSQTAGADGNYSRIILPGGFKTGMSGTGIYYPDGRATQRVGIKIDKLVHPTVKGISAGKDELLEAAVKQITTGVKSIQ